MRFGILSSPWGTQPCSPGSPHSCGHNCHNPLLDIRSEKATQPHVGQSFCSTNWHMKKCSMYPCNGDPSQRKEQQYLATGLAVLSLCCKSDVKNAPMQPANFIQVLHLPRSRTSVTLIEEPSVYRCTGLT
uniref:Uncharacterized protein n=1 Tax=Eutreptiella gymnastica TaxID=73025 RepID=A0A7S1J326_9EUGL|mmetsp:Transcript_61792/g.110021  ORF Transcript_61792/g.110021 Transcript_61792/m.110021 type:complete len:130 (+) Transcript_61792:737-1126(+)